METFSPFTTENVLYLKSRRVKVGLEWHQEEFLLTQESNAYMAWRKVFWEDPDSSVRQYSCQILWVEFVWQVAIERATKELAKLVEES